MNDRDFASIGGRVFASAVIVAFVLCSLAGIVGAFKLLLMAISL